MAAQPDDLAMAVLWHELECGGYSADLLLWEELADAAGGRILDLGCGTGRVALHLARRGHQVTGLDRDPALVQAFDERARLHGLPATATVADASGFDLGETFSLVLAPMQLAQILPPPGRHACLERIAAHLAPQGRAALAIVEGLGDGEGTAVPPLPDVRELDGWVYSSLPLETALGDGEMVVRRLRQTVSPSGVLSDALDEVTLQELSATGVEREAAAAGLAPRERRHVAATESHVGSTVVVLEAG